MPAVLAPGPLPEAGSPSLTPLRATLAVSWVLVLAAIGTVAVVLRAAMDLSRRRGKFVSAVTHELRTPLTTFRMYSDMLVEGMVLGEQARREYLATLRDESDHLSRLVENVLTYARIEQGRELPARRDRLTVDELIARATVRPAERARRAGAKLSIDLRNADAEPSPDLAPGVASVVVATDVGAVEQIVGNLIDNAVRYAVPVDSRVDILISLDSPAVNRKAVPGMLCICVADHGPGVEAKDADRIFRPFVRGPGGVRAGQNTVVQGVGLGLAISRQLARHLGGDLKLCGPDGRGARFVLLLPIAR